MSYDTIAVSPELKKEMFLDKQPLGLTWNDYLKQCRDAWKKEQAAMP